MNIKINRMYKWMSPVLLVVLLCGCTAKVAETDENGLPPHISVDLQLPEELKIGSSNVFSVQVSKRNVPLEHAEKAEFVIWPENDKDAAVIIQADEPSPVRMKSLMLLKKKDYMLCNHVSNSLMLRLCQPNVLLLEIRT